MHKLVGVSEMRAIEKAANAAGLSYARMMDNAGQSLANEIIAHSHQGEKSILGLVGPGNNGGDTLVALARLTNKGWKAAAYLVGSRPVDDPLLKGAKTAGVEIINSENDPGYRELKRLVTMHGVVLDGLLGTGMCLPLREPFGQVLRDVKAIAKTRVPFVIAVDCPSGMDCDSGEVATESLKADLTVTMAAVKRGMLTLPAFEILGELRVGDIGLTDSLPEWAAIHQYVIDEEMARSALPARPLNAHKGTFGTALIVAGSQRFPGAALLAGEAAYRSGAGLVTIAVPESIQPGLAGHLREATWLPLPAENGWIAAQAADVVIRSLERVTAILLGPGLGQETVTGRFVEEIIKVKLPPAVIDADGLKLLAKIPDWYKRLQPDCVLTPHPGEMAILTGLTAEEIQSARLETAQKFAKQWGQIVVLKGAFSVVAAPDGRAAVLPLATPALARAGTGDVLAGLITGLRAQGVAAFEAACAAVWFHGQAGLRAAQRLGGSAGVLAGDLIAEIPALIGK